MLVFWIKSARDEQNARIPDMVKVSLSKSLYELYNSKHNNQNKKTPFVPSQVLDQFFF
jgi:hypothetical protein